MASRPIQLLVHKGAWDSSARLAAKIEAKLPGAKADPARDPMIVTVPEGTKHAIRVIGEIAGTSVGKYHPDR